MSAFSVGKDYNLMIRRLFATLLCVAFLLSEPLDVLAADGNMDGSGGGMGSGTGESYWSPGHDGVRITVIEKKTRKAVGNSFDRTNISLPSKIISFARKNKLQYLSGANLAPNSSDYDKKIPDVPLPQIISSNASSNIAAVKAYFTDEGRIRAIAKDASITYDNLISDKFTILIEPIAYFKYNGVDYAMTATEAALYDRIENGNLRKAMGNLTHQNQPLSMFLEVSELGIPAWGGGGGIISDDNIIKYLGVGTVNFGDEALTPPPVTETYDYKYRADTDVVTAITVSTASEINPDGPGRARFNLPGGSITKEYVIPSGESQLVWVKWRTPDENTVVTIPVDINKGNVSKAIITCKITKLEEDTPPNPEGRDRNDGFSLKPHPNNESVSSLNWGEWWAQWHPYWVWISDYCDDDDCSTDHGWWEDHGWWDFFWRSYQASLAVNVQTQPDERVPTANGNTIKSGYGINAEVQVNMNTNGGSDNTSEVQHIITVFPEFDFDTYNRLLVPEGGSVGYNKTWNFKSNEYSQFENPVHFTPIWYPDDTVFPVTFTVLDAWTPAGQLYYVLTASDITIDGNVYQDWHIAPGFGNK